MSSTKSLLPRNTGKEGYKVEEEVHRGEGRRVDHVATKNGRRIAIERETGKSEIRGKLKKCKNAGYEEVQIKKI
jgi:hypothetical protein